MKDVCHREEAQKDVEIVARECQIQSARNRFEHIRKSIRSTLDKEAHGWIWALEQMTATMETESSLSSDVQAWRKLIGTYDALYELL